MLLFNSFHENSDGVLYFRTVLISYRRGGSGRIQYGGGQLTRHTTVQQKSSRRCLFPVRFEYSRAFRSSRRCADPSVPHFSRSRSETDFYSYSENYQVNTGIVRIL